MENVWFIGVEGIEWGIERYQKVDLEHQKILECLRIFTTNKWNWIKCADFAKCACFKIINMFKYLRMCLL